MGGTKDPAKMGDGNLTTLCRGCHGKVHQGSWELRRNGEGVRVVEQATGKQVMRRYANPGVDVPALLERLNDAERSLSQLLEALPYFSDEELKEAFSYANALSKRSWLLKAAVLHEAQERSRVE